MNYIISRLCFGGDAGTRTRVQTSNPNAFYMLISLLVVGSSQVTGNQCYTLAFKISRALKGIIHAIPKV